jgi:hypothetical protein
MGVHFPQTHSSTANGIKARHLEQGQRMDMASNPGKVPRLTTAFDTEVAYVNDFLCGARLLEYAHFHWNPVG